MPNTLKDIHRRVASIIEEATVATKIASKSSNDLKLLHDEWRQGGGSEEGLKLITSVQGITGMMLTLTANDPASDRTFADLRQTKLKWLALANSAIDLSGGV